MNAEAGSYTHQETRDLFDEIPAMIWYKDHNNKILRCNKLAAASAGLQIVEMEGHDAKEFYPAEAGKYHQYDLEVLHSGKPSLGVIRPHMNLFGENRWFQTDHIPFRGSENGPGVIIHAIDVTDLKKIEDDLQNAHQFRKDLLADVSHDLKNPLSTILLIAGTLTKIQISPNYKNLVSKQAEILRRAALQMDRLIQDLLDQTSIEAGRLSLHFSRCLPEALFAQLSDLFQPLARRQKVHLRFAPPPKKMEILCDENRLIQVFSNLLGNAIKFTPEHGCIQVSAVKLQNKIRFRVSDTGSGIALQDLPHLFDRYWQATHTKRQGTGLGLSIVKGIVEAHHGRVWVESQQELGTSFSFTLPVEATE